MFTTIEFWAWAASILLALLYALAGVMKGFRPIADLSKMMGWPGDVPAWLVRFIGFAELAGAIGLILPVWTGILAWLTPLAAIGLSLVQVLAIPFHIRRGEGKAVPMNLVLLALSLFVLWAHRGLIGF